MKRTVEKVLAVISAVVNFIGLIGFAFVMFIGFAAYTDDEIYTDLDLSPAEVGGWGDFTAFIMGFSGVIVVIIIISIILSIIGVVKIDKNAKAAGIMFFIASFLSGIVSIPGILLIIAGIMALTRKEPTTQDEITPYQTGS